jgi:large subunit ribosomal protein L25
MEEVILQGKFREVVGKQVHALRRQGRVPAVIYGKGLQPIIISLDLKESSHVLPGISSSHLITVDIEGKKHVTLVREKQRHPVTGTLLHVDFQEVSETEKIRTTVAIELQGESPAVKNYDGIIVSGLEELEVECLPGDLIDQIVVDISVLKEIGDTIYVRDIILPPQIEVLTDSSELVVVVTAPSIEPEEVVEEEVAVPEIEPEVIEKGKKEEEEF